MKLSDKALLVQLRVSEWTARKYDRKATEQVALQNGTDLSAGRYNKSLLPMNDYLADVHSKTRHIRQKFYKNTLPWGLEGMQILPSGNYLQFVQEFRQEKAEWEYLVSTFIEKYSELKRDAQRILGNLYSEDDYPDASVLLGKFSIDMAVFPVPNDDFRVQIADDELNRIQAEVTQRVQDAQTVAMKEVWGRLFERVQHIANKLADPSAIFRDSMLENAKEICELLPRLNITDDPNLEQMRQDVEAKLLNNNPESLRLDPRLREDKAKEAKEIMDKMSVFMGGL